MNHPITSPAAPNALDDTLIAFVANASPIANDEITISCARPSVPMPTILPRRSCFGRIAESSISTTREAFSSITPLATQIPYPKSCP